MITGNLDRVLASIPEDGRVLDIGGWAAPLNRADYVLDLMPYDTRGVRAPGSFGPPPERFTEETWIQRDICDKDPYPFEDDFFDFVFCSQTLEDIRDPVWVAREMGRIGKAGYIDVPSVLDELCWSVPEMSGGGWCGHLHHRWLITLEDDEMVFMHKPHSMHTEPRLRIPPRWQRHLTDGDRGVGYFWEGQPKVRERIVIGFPPVDELEGVILGHFAPTRAERLALRAQQRLLGLRQPLKSLFSRRT
jgi:SAM-dependent methyltransferase